jgi:hypothetical protein
VTSLGVLPEPPAATSQTMMPTMTTPAMIAPISGPPKARLSPMITAAATTMRTMAVTPERFPCERAAKPRDVFEGGLSRVQMREWQRRPRLSESGGRHREALGLNPAELAVGALDECA